jgi:hypothetical protein
MKKLLYLFLVFAFLSCGSKKSVSSEEIAKELAILEEIADAEAALEDKSPFLAIVEAVTSDIKDAALIQSAAVVSADSQKTDVSYLGVMRGIVIDKIAEEGQFYIGKDADRDGKGVIAMELLNENNTTLVFQYKFSNKEVADNYKANKTKALLIAASPNIFSKRVKSLDIIVKKRYYYNNKIILEITVYPNEWND